MERVAEVGPVLTQFAQWAQHNEGASEIGALNNLAEHGGFDSSAAVELAGYLTANDTYPIGLSEFLASPPVMARYDALANGDQPQLGIAEYVIKALTQRGRTADEIVQTLELPDSYPFQVISIRDQNGWQLDPSQR
jgi:hypothetical protein